MYPLSMQIEVWHPDASEEHYLAELRYDRRSGGEINLLFSSQMESCLSHGPPNFLNELPLQRLEGVAVYDRNRHLPLATSISLRGITGGTTFGLFSTSIATYKVKDIYFGDGVPVHDNVEIKEVIWALEGVESWLDPITERFSSGHPDRETWKLEYPIEGLGNLSIYKEAFSLPIMSIQYEAARSISESDKIVSYIQNLITLATGKFHPILWLKCVISGNIAETQRYCQQKEPYEFIKTQFEAKKHNLGWEMPPVNATFLFKNLKGAKGIAEWAREMEIREAFGDAMPNTVRNLIEGHIWNPVYSDNSFLQTASALLALHPKINKNDKISNQIDQCISLIGRQIVPPYIDMHWCDAVAHLRNKLLIHYEDRHAVEYPEKEADGARKLIYNLGISSVLKQVMNIPDSDIKQFIWDKRVLDSNVEQLVENLKEWHSMDKTRRSAFIGNSETGTKSPQNKIKQKDILNQILKERIDNIQKTFMPPRSSQLPSKMFRKKKSGRREYICEKCGTKWKLTKFHNMWEAMLKGKYNSPDENRWHKIYRSKTIKECEAVARFSLYSHFCYKPNEHQSFHTEAGTVTYSHVFEMYNRKPVLDSSGKSGEIECDRGTIVAIKLSGGPLPMTEQLSVFASQSGYFEATWLGLDSEEAYQHFRSFFNGHYHWECLQVCYKDGRREAVELDSNSYVGELNIASGKVCDNGYIVKASGKILKDGE